MGHFYHAQTLWGEDWKLLYFSLETSPPRGKDSSIFLLEILRIDASSVASLFGQFGLSTMTRCLTKNNDINPNLSTSFGTTLLYVCQSGLGEDG